jgi:hypothetical protein
MEKIKPNPLKILLCLFMLTGMFVSCEDDDPVVEKQDKPEIQFTAESDEYKAKRGTEITMTAVVTHAENPVYTWKLNGRIVATEAEFVYNCDKLGAYFFTFRVDADNGSAEKQVKLSVFDKLAPQLSLANYYEGFAGEDLTIDPGVQDPEGVTYEWIIDGKVISTDPVLIFNRDQITSYDIVLSASNEDGYTMAATTIALYSKPQPALFFDDGYYRTAEDRPVRMSVPIGRSLVLAPVKVLFGDHVTYHWSVDGTSQAGVTGEYFTFTPGEQKTYEIEVTAADGNTTLTAKVSVECVAPEMTYYRAVTASSSAKVNKSYGFVQAPGQFVSISPGTTETQMTANATSAVLSSDGNWCFSLGAFGGYVVMGFDHSVENVAGKPDLQINGNAFAGWSEPGIIYVMQDSNGDNLPNDAWYELKGSEYGTARHTPRYAHTYYKPVGSPDRLKQYPNFVAGDRVIFVGSCLSSTIENDGIITNPGFDWGYVDNTNSKVGFFIEDAVQADGTPADLKFIDFVKVQTAVNAMAGILGEISTETGPAIDMHLQE